LGIIFRARTDISSQLETLHALPLQQCQASTEPLAQCLPKVNELVQIYAFVLPFNEVLEAEVERYRQARSIKAGGHDQAPRAALIASRMLSASGCETCFVPSGPMT